MPKRTICKTLLFGAALLALADHDTYSQVRYSSRGVPLDHPDALYQQSGSIEVSLDLRKDGMDDAKSPTILLTVKNLDKDGIPFPDEHLHVVGPKGEPPTTLRQRQITHNLQPGEEELRADYIGPLIEPNESSTRKLPVKQYYDISEPGTYSVFVEVEDRVPAEAHKDVWVRSNTITFFIPY